MIKASLNQPIATALRRHLVEERFTFRLNRLVGRLLVRCLGDGICRRKICGHARIGGWNRLIFSRQCRFGLQRRRGGFGTTADPVFAACERETGAYGGE